MGFKCEFKAPFFKDHVEKGFTRRHRSVVEFAFQPSVHPDGIQIGEGIGNIIFTGIGFGTVKVLFRNTQNYRRTQGRRTILKRELGNVIDFYSGTCSSNTFPLLSNSGTMY